MTCVALNLADNTNNKPFPKLMKNEDGSKIVLFTAPSIGTVIYDPGRTFEYSIYWDMNKFSDLENDTVITLSNGEISR